MANLRPASELHLSGVLVVTRRESVDRCRRELEALPGVEVHHADAASGRLIVVLESRASEGQEERLRAIQALPTVQLAALVEHRVVSGNDDPIGEGG